jgi:hypothetical protein
MFTGENYHIWSVKMQAFLEAYDLWEIVSEDKPVAPLPTNPLWLKSSSAVRKRQRNPRQNQSSRILWQKAFSTELWHAIQPKRLGTN